MQHRQRNWTHQACRYADLRASLAINRAFIISASAATSAISLSLTLLRAIRSRIALPVWASERKRNAPNSGYALSFLVVFAIRAHRRIAELTRSGCLTTRLITA